MISKDITRNILSDYIEYDQLQELINYISDLKLNHKRIKIEEDEYGLLREKSIYIDGKLRCIKDSFWYNCPGGHGVDDFVRTIQDAYEGIR